MKNQKEVFKDIPTYKGLYQVSNIGNVKSLERYVKNKHGVRVVKEKIKQKSIDDKGYVIFNLWKGNKGKTIQVHKLVAMAFLGHYTDGTLNLVIDHINNDKLDNRVENLQIITNRENVSKGMKGGTSEYTGVYWNKRAKKWIARIRINNERPHLGCFEKEIDAHNAYQHKLKTL